MEGVVINEYCTYQKGFPPVGLSPDLLARCKEVEDDGREGPMQPFGEDVELKGRMMVMKGGEEVTR